MISDNHSFDIMSSSFKFSTPVSVSAPSKLILHGEHAVVFGKTAVAAAIDLRTRMEMRPNGEGEIAVEFPDVGVKKRTWKVDEVGKVLFSKTQRPLSSSSVDGEVMERIHRLLEIGEEEESRLETASLSLICFFYLYRAVLDEPVAMEISVESEIPIGAGLGSSAALSVCLAAGLLAIRDEVREGKAVSQGPGDDREEICRLAFVSERILHGNPSGVDNSVSTYGGIVKFAKGEISSLDHVSFRPRVLLINSEVSRSTKVMVDRVRAQSVRTPQAVDGIMEAIDGISRDCLGTLEDETASDEDKFEKLEYLVSCNQKQLEALKVSHPSLDEICRIAAGFGLNAKLTGAGGGGFAFVLVPPGADEEAVSKTKEEMEKKGFTCYETSLGAKGVVLEKSG